MKMTCTSTTDHRRCYFCCWQFRKWFILKGRYFYCELTVGLVWRQIYLCFSSHHTSKVPASAAVKFQISLSLPADAEQEVVLHLLLLLRAQRVTVYLLINMILGIALCWGQTVFIKLIVIVVKVPERRYDEVIFLSWLTFLTLTDLFRSCFLRFPPCWSLSLLQTDILSGLNFWPDWEEDRPALLSLRWGCQAWPSWEGTERDTWTGLWWLGWRWLGDRVGTDSFWKVQAEINISSLQWQHSSPDPPCWSSVWPGLTWGCRRRISPQLRAADTWLCPAVRQDREIRYQTFIVSLHFLFGLHSIV